VSPKLELAQTGGITPLTTAINVLGALSISFGTVYQKRYATALNLASGGAWQYVGASLAVLIPALLMEDLRFDGSFQAWFALGWSVIVLSLGAITLLMLMIRLGDVGRVDDEGYLYLTDRKAYMIISGGVNIYPQEAENILVTHPKVVDVAVFGVPDDEFGEQVKAVVQPRDMAEAGPALAAELIAWCRERLAHIKCPRSIDFDAELPRHPTGKLYKRLLRDRYWQGRSTRIN
jgi:acyl-CoA synthetase (AMP-forming)/AMP-acid ligase II